MLVYKIHKLCIIFDNTSKEGDDFNCFLNLIYTFNETITPPQLSSIGVVLPILLLIATYLQP